MDDEIRYRTEQVPLTFGQRAEMWWNGVVDAIRANPETHWTLWIQVKKGEPGYDTAPFTCHVDPNPRRFRYENGEFKNVEPSDEITEPNPNWHA